MELLDPQERFRSVGGSLVYLSAGKPDIAFSVSLQSSRHKVFANEHSRKRESTVIFHDLRHRHCSQRRATREKRQCASHNIGEKDRRMLWRFQYLNEPKDIHCYTDAMEDAWLTRRSTSGGSSMENISSICGDRVSPLPCWKGLCSELRRNHGPPKIRTDSSAARAMTTRKGAGPVTHLEIRMLCLQEQTHQSELIIENVNTLAKYLSENKLNTLMKGFNQEFHDGVRSAKVRLKLTTTSSPQQQRERAQTMMALWF